ncbi:hypothetical protein BG418_25630 [Streptomyces sp. CBMA152]|nr:hypothetical protein [Streptomyces sp. CBMA152]
MVVASLRQLVHHTGVTSPPAGKPVSKGPWAGLSQTGTGASGSRPMGTTVWRTCVGGVLPSAAGNGMRTPSMSSRR